MSQSGHASGGARRHAAIVVVMALAGACSASTASPPIGTPTARPAAASPASPAASSSTLDAAAATPTASVAPSPTQVVAWTAVTRTKPILGGQVFGGDGNQYLIAVTGYQDGFVAVGEDCCGKADAVVGAVWASPDGTSWTRIEPVDVFGASVVEQVAASGSRLVAIGTSRAQPQGADPKTLVWLSGDGLAWRRSDAASAYFTASFRPAGIAGGPAGFIAWGESPSGQQHVAFSADGEDWTDVGFADAYPGTLVGGISPWRGGWAAAGSQRVKQPAGIGASTPGPARAWFSADGVNWSPGTADGLAIGAPLAGADGLLALGAASKCGACIGPDLLWHSGDGRVWLPLGPDKMNRRYAADGTRVVRLTIDVDAPANADETLETSLDGVHWTTLAKGLPGEQHLGVAVGDNGVLLLEPQYRQGATDQVDGGVWYLPAR